MTHSNAILAIMLVLISSTVSYADVSFTQEDAAIIFKTYDVEKVYSPDCQDNAIFHKQFCPPSRFTACAEISKIQAHCKKVLGNLAVDGLPTDTGVNALEGCVKYVGYHKLDKSHMACCESEACELWLDELQGKPWFETTDDEEDYYYEEEDDDDDDDDVNDEL